MAVVVAVAVLASKMDTYEVVAVLPVALLGHQQHDDEDVNLHDGQRGPDDADDAARNILRIQHNHRSVVQPMMLRTES